MKKLVILGIVVLVLVMILVLFLPCLLYKVKADNPEIVIWFQTDNSQCGIIQNTNGVGDGVVDKIDENGLVTPFIKDKEVFIPLAKLVAILEGKTKWDKDKRMVTIIFQNGLIKIRLWVGKATAEMINGDSAQKFKLNTAPVIEYGRTFVPLDFIRKVLQPSDIIWDSELNLLILIWPLGI